ncbi:ABC transporter ATP-binding protein [Methylobacterium planeticum]|uniref:ABC transporter ATP-binding protein n=1 Tax=Methylobacterium planeticum TaxID=2615211 RepID=A0A6N6MPR0_9HYPH|nr:ABC transporter ATP-binding protein [Methylobacterium planeticum]KAB1073502.1 ABC transporter ATP-binding protein [Methylobacterium planeticum]
MSTVALRSLVKRYGNVNAVDDITLDVAEGQLVALLGPSGCGKTTTLRMIGGFVEASAGSILIGGTDVTRLPPARRNIGFGFQSYALFPHMSVAQNVAFGLEMRRLPRAEIAQRVNQALDRVRLRAMADRLPKHLSGGQQQRVSLARALVIEPSLLLLDEPLSNLDAQLRGEMKLEIRQIQKAMGITTIFVTHDQDEALSIADRIVVMRSGRIEQDGTPESVFAAPRSRFVAEFMGVTNLLPGTFEASGCFRLTNGAAIRISDQAGAPERESVLAIRPERIRIARAGATPGPDDLPAEIEAATYRGLTVEYRLRTGSGLHLTARQPTPATGGPTMLEPGACIHIGVPTDACLLIPA